MKNYMIWMAKGGQRGVVTEKKSKPVIEDKGTRNVVNILLVVIGYALIYLLATGFWNLSGLDEFLIGLVLVLVLGAVMKWFNGFSGWVFLFLLSTKRGIHFIDNVSKKYRTFWNEMPTWGMVLGFGLLTWPFLKGRFNKKTFAFSILSLAFILAFVLPSLSNGLQFINLPQVQQAAAQSAHAAPAPTYETYLLWGFIILTGFSGFVIAELAWNAFLVIDGIAQYLSQLLLGPVGGATTANTAVLTSQIPGVAPLIPGFQVPLIAGIIAFALALILHEMSHGVLSRIYNVKLKSVGLLMVGIIPMGGFVEPEEKQVEKLSDINQTKMFAAGVSANFILMMVFFALMLPLIYYVLPSIANVFVTSTIPNTPAYNVIMPGTIIYSWDGHNVTNIASLGVINDTPGQKIHLITSKGNYNFTAVSIQNSTKGYVGVELAQGIKNTTGAQAWYFIYSVIALALVINFLVGIANMLPIPAFDGWRIYNANIKNRKLMGTIAALILIIIILNAVPWYFQFAFCHTPTLSC